MIKILCLHNANHRASYRYRVALFLPYWSSYNITVKAECISGKEYINTARYLLKFHDYDYVLLQKKIVPTILVDIIAKQSQLIYDFDDALYTRESRELEQKRLPSNSTVKKLNYILKKSTIVFAGSPELARYGKTCNENAHIIPTALGKQIADPVKQIGRAHV